MIGVASATNEEVGNWGIPHPGNYEAGPSPAGCQQSTLPFLYVRIRFGTNEWEFT
jgi:hypothetical protein